MPTEDYKGLTILTPDPVGAGGALIQDNFKQIADWNEVTEATLEDHEHAASDITSGTFADARVAESNVTQHQTALALGAGQITSGTFADARVAESNVTQHQAAINHNALANLTTGDPHTQYVLADGSREVDGDFTVEGDLHADLLVLEDKETIPTLAAGTGGICVADSPIGSVSELLLIAPTSGRVRATGSSLRFGEQGTNITEFQVFVVRHVDSGGGAPIWNTRKARGTPASPADVVNGDRLGLFAFSGFKDGDFEGAARLDVRVDAAPGSEFVPGRYEFLTTDPAGAFAERARLTSEGDWLIGTTSKPSANPGKVLVLGDKGNDPTFAGTTAGLWNNDGDLFVQGTGSVTQISPHAKNAPAGIYTKTPGIEWVDYTYNVFLGTIVWYNKDTGQRLEETFDEYNQRFNLRPGDSGYKEKLDWDEQENKADQRVKEAQQAWDAQLAEATQEQAKQVSEWAKEVREWAKKPYWDRGTMPEKPEDISPPDTPRPADYIKRPNPWGE